MLDMVSRNLSFDYINRKGMIKGQETIFKIRKLTQRIGDHLQFLLGQLFPRNQSYLFLDYNYKVMEKIHVPTDKGNFTNNYNKLIQNFDLLPRLMLIHQQKGYNEMVNTLLFP